MRKFVTVQIFSLGFLSLAGSAIAQNSSDWLTMVGMPGDASHITIEVQPTSHVVIANRASLNVRVNRSNFNTSSEGIPFRSYTATILIDCLEKTARFTSVAFYMMPIWEGKRHKIVSWSEAEVRPVLFRNFVPNPREKIIRAACRMTPQ